MSNFSRNHQTFPEATPSYITTKNVQAFQFLHSLASTNHFPWWLMFEQISCAFWPCVNILWRNIYTYPLPTFSLDCLGFCYHNLILQARKLRHREFRLHRERTASWDLKPGNLALELFAPALECHGMQTPSSSLREHLHCALLPQNACPGGLVPNVLKITIKD